MSNIIPLTFSYICVFRIFQIFAVINNAVMNNLGIIYFHIVGGVSSAENARSWTAESKVKCLGNFVLGITRFP